MEDNTITISEVRQYSRELKNALKKLIPQLNRSLDFPADDHILKLLSDNNSTLFVAKDNNSKIVGMLTLVTYQIPSGLRTWIEDVVVDSAFRGKGIGKLLMSSALKYCKEKNWNNVNLTSSPNRVSANNMYKKLGFELRETNCYRKNEF